MGTTLAFERLATLDAAANNVLVTSMMVCGRVERRLDSLIDRIVWFCEDREQWGGSII
jgi:hypothetical protein